MEAKWDPQNKSQYMKGIEENIWRECPDRHIPELKREFDKKRFGCREASTSEEGGPIMQPEHDPDNSEVIRLFL
ncbi:Hypothetical predicted protein [Paramuricea clavata]|uniref:Uncharacterized protein n=1 Tax=Paramuricea clavata TaxID=317549 RepID=A0A6S7JQ01_PARCT|nr:Hypothetical predicted protein [Paramuricea clavata]